MIIKGLNQFLKDQDVSSFSQYLDFRINSQKNYDVTFYDINLEILLKEYTIAGNTKIKIIPLTDSLKTLEIDLMLRYSRKQSNSMPTRHLQISSMP